MMFGGRRGSERGRCSAIVLLFSCPRRPRLQGEVIAQLDKELIKTRWFFIVFIFVFYRLKCFCACLERSDDGVFGLLVLPPV